MSGKPQNMNYLSNLTTPQRRLKKWIFTKYTSAAEFARDIGLNPRFVYSYIRDDGSVLGKRYHGRLVELGLDVTWYTLGIRGDSSAIMPESPKKYIFQALESFKTVQQEEKIIKLYTDTIEGVQKYAEANIYEFDFALEKLIVDRLAQISDL